MKTASIALTCAALALLWPAIARTPAQPPSGRHGFRLCQGPLDQGMPGVILTLVDDSGRLIGGIAFNAVSRNDGPPRILSHHPHAIMNLRFDRYTLRFVVLRRDERLRVERPPS